MENPPPPPPPPPPLPVKEVRFNTAEEELAKAKEKVEELERAMREQAEAAKQQAEEKKESTTTTTTTTTDVFQMEEDLSGSEDLSISSCDTSLGVERRRRKSTVTGVEYSDSNDDSDSSAPAARPAPTVRAKSKSKGRSKSRSTTSSKAADLDTLVPETEFLDIHRLDIDKVVSLHRYYDGCSVPHYLSHAFDEGYLTDVKTHIPDDHKETLVPVGVIEAVFTNHSRKKDSADILKYCIYVLKKTGETIYDAATSLFYEDGTAIGRISCLFGSVGEPSYLVQDRLAEVEEEEENDYTEATPHASVGDVLYTSALYATTLYEEPERPDQKKESATDVLTRKYHTPGCDASFLEDEELPVEKQEFSDDEKEQAAKAEKKRKRAEPRDMSKTSIGLLDCLSDSGTSSVNSEFEFNSDGEIIQVIRKSEACPKTKKLRKTRGARSAVPAPSGKAAPGAVPFFVPQPPPLIKGDPKKVFVADVPSSLEWHQLAAIMGASFGTVEEAVIKVKKSKKDGSDKAFAFVTFQDERVARQAVFIGKTISPDGRIMRITRSRPERLRHNNPHHNVVEVPKKPEPELPPRESSEEPDGDMEELEL